VFRYRAGTPWRDRPERFGPWQTVWKRHHRWSADGTWDRVLSALLVEADAGGQIDRRVSVDHAEGLCHLGQRGRPTRRDCHG
jgi:transposase